MTTRTAAIYTRISDDRAGGGLGVERQEKDCRALAKRLGWDVVEVFVDNDLTAYSKSRKAQSRPAYDRLMADLTAGRFRGVLAWHTDRLHRTPRQLEDFIDVIESQDVPVETVEAGLVDLRTPSGRAMARTLCAWAHYESEHKGERIRAKYVQLAEQGLPGNGGFRPFGYTKDRLGLVYSEAEHLRWAYEQLLSGRSLRSIVADLNERGVRSSQGKPWTMQALRYNLRSGRNTGLREHRGVIAGDAVWPAIIDRETWKTAQTILLKADRTPTYRDGSMVSNARKHLLTGFLWCGRDGCDLRLVARTGGTSAQYGCRPVKDGGCSGSTVMISHAEQHLTALVLARLERDADLTPDRPADPTAELRDQISVDEQRLEDLAKAFAEDVDANPLELRAAGARIRARIEAARREIARTVITQRISEPLLVREAWPDYDLAQKRLVVGTLIERVTVGPGTGGRFNPDRLSVTWR